MDWRAKLEAKDPTPKQGPLPGFLSKEAFSPSGLDTAITCEASWGFVYLEGRRGPELAWSDIQAAARAEALTDDMLANRGASFGEEMHAVLEAYYLGEKPDWASMAGQVAQSGLHLLPLPGECLEIFAEAEIDVAGLGEDPVTYRGIRDLLCRVTPAGLKRLGIVSPTGWVLFDFKSTIDFKYQKTAAELRRHPQGVIYPVDVFRRVGADLVELPCRWVYFRTGFDRADRGTGEYVLAGKRAAQATDFRVTRAEADAGMRQLDMLARKLREHMRAAADPNTLDKDLSACKKFRGCPHARSRGGTCNQRKTENSMATENKAMSFADKIAAAKKASADAAAANLAQAPVEEQPAAPAEVAQSAPVAPAAPTSKPVNRFQGQKTQPAQGTAERLDEAAPAPSSPATTASIEVDPKQVTFGGVGFNETEQGFVLEMTLTNCDRAQALAFLLSLVGR